jgi:membrane-bound ClpP family serine protease
MIYRDFDFVTNDALWRAGLTVAFTLLAVVAGAVLLIAMVSRRGAPSGLVLASRLGSDTAVTERTSRGWAGWFGAHDRLERDDTRAAAVDAPSEQSLLGATGTASSDLRPGGIVDIDGRRVDAITSGEFIPAGEPIEVVRDDRYRRVVRRRT